jgi:hypothetical protein
MIEFTLLCILLLALLGMPLAAIWAVNTLFGLGIAYTFETWCAAGILFIFFAPNGTSSSTK